CITASSIMSCVNNAGEKPVNECTHNLLNMVSKRCHDLGETELNTVKSLIFQYQDIFALDENMKGGMNIVTHKINTGDAQPIRQYSRRLPLTRREEAERIAAVDSAEEPSLGSITSSS
ncbi:hypothetical protein CBL_12022, partial [Carabus blaptoides fortunei]